MSELHEERNVEYQYIFNIVVSNKSNFTIFAPISIDDTHNNITSIMKNMRMWGEGNFNIIDTMHGKALQIQANNNITIFSQYNTKDEAINLTLSMDVDYSNNSLHNRKCWLYCDKLYDNQNISIDFLLYRYVEYNIYDRWGNYKGFTALNDTANSRVYDVAREWQKMDIKLYTGFLN
jgi:hypothetical protein